jgi:hypothetical protein
MITSFGNDESDSDESEQEELVKKELCSKKNSLKASQNSKPLIELPSKVPESSDSKIQMGPSLSMIQYGPQNKEKPIESMQVMI